MEMNSHHKSIGNVFLASLMVVVIGGCASKGPAEKDELTKEISLKQDRSQFDELRKDIPAPVRQENDELALILKTFGELKDEPFLIREKWSRETRKRRDEFERNVRLTREKRSGEEKTKREKFLDGLKSERESFVTGKHSSEERGRFFDGADTKRRDYFSAERERHDRFESELREGRQDFENGMRRVQGQFDQEYRDYVKKYDEHRRENEKREVEKKKQQANDTTNIKKPTGLPSAKGASSLGSGSVPENLDPDLLEFRNRPSGPALPVKSGENE